jgi:GNAT superfamily N-acetyltransferase
VLQDAMENHLSWFGRHRARVEIAGVSVFLGQGDVVLGFPSPDADVSGAVEAARASGAHEISCWTLEPSAALGAQLTALGFQDGWQPHWMGIDPRSPDESSEHDVEETLECVDGLPYSPHQPDQLGGDGVHHFVARADADVVGHTVLNVEGTTGGLYDMGVAPRALRRGYGRALTLAALACAREAGCTSVTLNATGEGERLYGSVGFASLGHGMTWWLFAGH